MIKVRNIIFSINDISIFFENIAYKFFESDFCAVSTPNFIKQIPIVGANSNIIFEQKITQCFLSYWFSINQRSVHIKKYSFYLGNVAHKAGVCILAKTMSPMPITTTAIPRICKLETDSLKI